MDNKLYEFDCKNCKHNYVNVDTTAECPKCKTTNQTNRRIK